MNKLLQQIAELPYISTGTPLTTTDIANYQSTLLQHGLPLMPKSYKKCPIEESPKIMFPSDKMPLYESKNF